MPSHVSKRLHKFHHGVPYRLAFELKAVVSRYITGTFTPVNLSICSTSHMFKSYNGFTVSVTCFIVANHGTELRTM